MRVEGRESINSEMIRSQAQSTDNEACLDWLHKNCFKEILAIERGIEERKVALA